jgi:hypothetical protein
VQTQAAKLQKSLKNQRYYLKNKERLNGQKMAQYHQNKEKFLERMLRYNQRNKEKISHKAKEYYKNHKREFSLRASLNNEREREQAREHLQQNAASIKVSTARIFSILLEIY